PALAGRPLRRASSGAVASPCGAGLSSQRAARFGIGNALGGQLGDRRPDVAAALADGRVATWAVALGLARERPILVPADGQPDRPTATRAVDEERLRVQPGGRPEILEALDDLARRLERAREVVERRRVLLKEQLHRRVAQDGGGAAFEVLGVLRHDHEAGAEVPRLDGPHLDVPRELLYL